MLRLYLVTLSSQVTSGQPYYPHHFGHSGQILAQLQACELVFHVVFFGVLKTIVSKELFSVYSAEQ